MNCSCNSSFQGCFTANSKSFVNSSYCIVIRQFVQHRQQQLLGCFLGYPNTINIIILMFCYYFLLLMLHCSFANGYYRQHLLTSYNDEDINSLDLKNLLTSRPVNLETTAGPRSPMMMQKAMQVPIKRPIMLRKQLTPVL